MVECLSRRCQESPVFASKTKNHELDQLKATIQALNHSQAVIEFGMDGTIATANDNFLDTMGYSLVEIQGKHHSMFLEEEHRQSAAYRAFWESLNRGEFQAAE